jgi:hypothetical protein
MNDHLLLGLSLAALGVASLATGVPWLATGVFVAAIPFLIVGSFFVLEGRARHREAADPFP